jgi:hypothetical protein
MYDALNIQFEAGRRLVICRPHGTIDEYFAIQLLNFLFALEEVSNPFNRVLDLTLVTEAPLTSAGILEYAEARRQATTHLQQFRTAIITPGVETESLARLYAMLIKDSKIEADVFPNASCAAQWLGVPEDAVRLQSSVAKPR